MSDVGVLLLGMYAEGEVTSLECVQGQLLEVLAKKLSRCSVGRVIGVPMPICRVDVEKPPDVVLYAVVSWISGRGSRCFRDP